MSLSDFQLIMMYLQRMVDDEKNLVENHKMNLKLIQDCLDRIKVAYINNIQAIGEETGNGQRPENWRAKP